MSKKYVYFYNLRVIVYKIPPETESISGLYIADEKIDSAEEYYKFVHSSQSRCNELFPGPFGNKMEIESLSFLHEAD